MLAMPLVFMNLSRNAVRDLTAKYKIDLDDLLVVCDDLDLELSRMKIRKGGSSGGHRGLDSVISSLGSDSFARLRIGIGRPPKGVDPADYVLSAFTKKENKQIGLTVERAVVCCEAWDNQGITKAMNIFNKKEPKDE